MKIRLAAAGLLVLLGFTGAVGAYAIVARWETQQVPYYINPANGFVSESNAIAAIQAGANAWALQSGANVLPYYLGRTSGASVTNNGRNEIFFRNGSNGAYYGETYWWYDGSGRLIDADIVFYSTYPFFTGTTGCASGLYLEDATAHEFGHLLGLGHSGVAGATMYPSMPFCSTAHRQLDPDDVAGIEAMYPAAAANRTPSVSIASPTDGATIAEGSAATLSGSASDYEDGNLSSAISWTSSRDGQLGSGATVSIVLSAGSHTITARVTDSKGAASESNRTLSVSAAVEVASAGITLAARGYKVKGTRFTDLTWTGTTAPSIDIFRNGARVATVSNLGRYTDRLAGKGGGAFTYKVCAAGTSSCSAQVSVSY